MVIENFIGIKSRTKILAELKRKLNIFIGKKNIFNHRINIIIIKINILL